MTEKAVKNREFICFRIPLSRISPLSQNRDFTFPSLAPMAHAHPPSRAAERQCICGCKTTAIKTMNKHMREHSQWLSIKTTRLASLMAVFCLKRQSRPPTTGHSCPPTTEADEADNCDRPDSLVGGSEVVPEERTLQPDNSGVEDSDGSSGSEVNEGLLMDSDSDEFESDEEGTGRDATGEG